MFAGKARSLPQKEVPERCFTRVGSGLITLGWKGLPGTNALAYYEKSKFAALKSFITFGAVNFLFRQPAILAHWT
jgi:hypothetical protein